MALQGTLDTFAVTDLVRLLATTNKTGELAVDGDRGRGVLWFVDGALTTDDPAGDVTDAVFSLLRMEEGTFSFTAEARAETEGEPRSALDALEAAEGRLEEWRPIEALVPTAAVTLALRGDLPHDEVTVGRDRWRQLVAVAGGTTAGSFGEALGLDEVATGFAVHALVEAGLVEVGEPTDATEGAPADDGATDGAGPEAEAGPVEGDLAAVVALTPEPWAEAVGPEERFRLGDWEDPDVLARPLLPSGDAADEGGDALPDASAPWEPLTPLAAVGEEALALDGALGATGVPEETADAPADETPDDGADVMAGPGAPEELEGGRPVDAASLDVDLDRQLGAAPSGHSYLAPAAEDAALPEPLLSAPEELLPPPPADAAASDDTFEAGLSAEALSPAAARAVAAAAGSEPDGTDGDADAGRRVLRRIISTGKG